MTSLSNSDLNYLQLNSFKKKEEKKNSFRNDEIEMAVFSIMPMVLDSIYWIWLLQSIIFRRSLMLNPIDSQRSKN